MNKNSQKKEQAPPPFKADYIIKINKIHINKLSVLINKIV